MEGGRMTPKDLVRSLFKSFARQDVVTAGGESVLDDVVPAGGIPWSRPGQPVPSESEFRDSLCRSTSFTEGSPGRQSYIEGNIPRLYRVFRNIANCGANLQGPTLDVASGNGILFPALRQYLPQLLPYTMAELFEGSFHYDGVELPCVKFECERDRLPFPDNAFGCVVFNDCLEHLIVDPFWPLLEFNRVLKPGGHLVIATPNATALFRIISMLSGHPGTTETHIKPAAIYQRHNREWTPLELMGSLQTLGFDDIRYSTNAHLLASSQLPLRSTARDIGVPVRPVFDFGPELFCVGQKAVHKTLDMDLPQDERWPEWLYTGYDAYRRRPRVFPIVVSDDYA
jgi:SAM-dependent methyltransferase